MTRSAFIFNMITSNMRTDELLQQLKKSKAELEAQAKELEEKAKLLEVKNQEVESPANRSKKSRAIGRSSRNTIRVPRKHVTRATHASQ